MFFINLSFGQQKTLDVRHINTDEFPKISFDLWVRNPDGINQDAIKLFEESSVNPVKINFTKKEIVKEILKIYETH